MNKLGRLEPCAKRHIDTVASVADQAARAVICEQLKQASIWRTAVQNNNSAHACINGIKCGFGFRNHTTCNRAIRRQLADLRGCHLGQDFAIGVLYAGNIRQQQKAISLQCRSNCTRGSVAVDVERFAVFAGTKWGNDRNNVAAEQVLQNGSIHSRRCPNEAQFRIGLGTGDQLGVFARQTNRTATLGPDGLNNTLVDDTA
jgi:hypothetical protein